MTEKMTPEKASELMNQCYHCSQVIMYHTAEKLGLDKDMVVKMSAGLGGGCFHGKVCGTVSAGIMSLSMKYGFHEPNKKEQDDILKAKVHEYEERFIAQHGSLDCKDLLGGYDMSIPEHAAKINAEDLTCNCKYLCANACEILDDMLKD